MKIDEQTRKHLYDAQDEAEFGSVERATALLELARSATTDGEALKLMQKASDKLDDGEPDDAVGIIKRVLVKSIIPVDPQHVIRAIAENPQDLRMLYTQARAALDGDSNDEEHDALHSLVDFLERKPATEREEPTD